MHRREFLRQALWGLGASVPLGSLSLGEAIAAVAGRRYYVDSESGDDGHDGSSATQAWRSLQRLNKTPFAPGDQILFKRGGDYPGVFQPKGSGSASAPVVVDAYGGGTPPHLHADGDNPSTVRLQNIEYWTLRNLAISNQGPKPLPRRTGIHLFHEDFGVAQGIVLQGLHIHDINGSAVKQLGGGSAILVQASGKNRPTRYQGLTIQDNVIERSQRDGILFLGAGSRTGGLATGVTVRGNHISEVPGDCILVKGCDGALVEWNTVSQCTALPVGEAAAGIWPFDCDNTLIQYNEVADHKARADGEGFDADSRCRHTIIQYNYSHDNAGGLALICNDGRSAGDVGNAGTIVRFNVSIHDALRKTGTASLRLTGPVDGCEIYNNIIIIPEKPIVGSRVTAFKATSWQGVPGRTAIHDNIIVSSQAPDIDLALATATHIDENNFYAANGEAPAGHVSAGKADHLALERFIAHRPTLTEAIALAKACFVEGKVAPQALTLIQKQVQTG